MTNPYLKALELVKKHHGTSGQAALAKGILSLYNPIHPFSIGEVLGPLDAQYTAIVVAMTKEYGANGETEELRTAGRWVYENFPNLVEISETMNRAKGVLLHQWEKEREEERRKLYPNG